MSDNSGAKQEQPCLVRGLGRKCSSGFTVGCGKEEELGRGVRMGRGLPGVWGEAGTFAPCLPGIPGMPRSP